jgi:hypothetical protein
MAVMAPRVLLRERVSSRRRPVVTGSFTGAAAAGAMADDVVWAKVNVLQKRHKTASVSFKGSLLNI